MRNKKLSEFDFKSNLSGNEHILSLEDNTNKRLKVNDLVNLVTKQDVGLGNTNNTNDANKPISTLQQQALDGKADLIHNHNYICLGHEGNIVRGVTKLLEITNYDSFKNYTVSASLGTVNLLPTGYIEYNITDSSNTDLLTINVGEKTNVYTLNIVDPPPNIVDPPPEINYNWTQRDPGERGNGYLNSVTWSGTQFVAVGQFHTPTAASLILTSPDGITWTQRNSGTSNSNNVFGYLNSVTWSGTQFVAVGLFYGSDGYGSVMDTLILTSPDGITWTQRDPGFSNGELFSVTWSGTQFVAVGEFYVSTRTSLILTSPDGIIWTQRNSGLSNSNYGYLKSVIWSGTQFVAVGVSNPQQGSLILTSPDGITWTQRNFGLSNSNGVNLDSVIWSGTQFVAVGITFESSFESLIDPLILTSPDGITWTQRDPGPSTGYLNSVTWSGTQFVAVGNDYNRFTYRYPPRILTSPDGITWTQRDPGLSNGQLFSVTWSGTRFVAVGSNSTTDFSLILTNP